MSNATKIYEEKKLARISYFHWGYFAQELAYQRRSYKWYYWLCAV